MKKHLDFVLLILLLSLGLFSWSKNDDDNKVIEKSNASKIIGVWAKGNYFVSFAADGSYKTYLGDYFMDSGSYTYKNDTINCINYYSYTRTTYDIRSVNDNSISLIIHYIETENNTNKIDTLNYSRIQKDGYQMNNDFISNTYTASVENDGISKCYFQSSCLINYTIKDGSKYHTQTWNYCYVKPYIYSKRYTNETSIFYNQKCNNGKVYKDSVYFDNNWLGMKLLN